MTYLVDPIKIHSRHIGVSKSVVLPLLLPLVIDWGNSEVGADSSGQVGKPSKQEGGHERSELCSGHPERASVGGEVKAHNDSSDPEGLRGVMCNHEDETARSQR